MFYLWALCIVCVAEGRLWQVRDAAAWRLWAEGRTLTNVLLGVLALCVQSSALLLGAWLLGPSGLGWVPPVLDWSGWPWWVQLSVNMLVLTFLGYWVHRLMHASASLWRLHRVHHSDAQVSPSVVFRHHPLEEAISAVPAVVWSAMCLVDASVLEWSATLLLASALLQHSGIRWSATLEQRWSWLIPTPACHWVHHEEAYEPSNRNFSDHFPLWDWLFGTYMPPRPVGHDAVIYGVPGMTQLNAAELMESMTQRY